MKRLRITDKTIKALIAKSGNVCAFPECQQVLVLSENVNFIRICHIEAASPGGPRYNPCSNDEYRRSFANLLILCPNHHSFVDQDAGKYSVDALREMKQKHEDACREQQNQYRVSSKVIQDVQREMDRYWETIKKEQKEHKFKHLMPTLAAKLPNPKQGSRQFSQIYKQIDRIEDLFDYFKELNEDLNGEIREHLKNIGYDLSRYDAVNYGENPFDNRGWEMHNIGGHNALINLYIAVIQSEIMHLSEFVKLNPDDSKARKALEKAKKRLHDIAIRGGYAD